MFNVNQSMNAFANGASIGTGMRNRETQNAFSQKMGQQDYAGARDYAYDRGNMQLAQGAEQAIAQMNDQQKAEAAQRSESLARIGMGLRQIPYEGRAQALQQQLPALQAMGIDPQQLSGFDPTDTAIDGILAQVTPMAELLKQAQPQDMMNVSSGSAVFDPNTGQQVYHNAKPETDDTPWYITEDGVDPRYIQAQSTKSPLVNVNTGDAVDSRPRAAAPGSGYEQYWDEAQGRWIERPIIGGKVDRADGNRQTRAERAGGTVVQDIGRALELQQQPGLTGDLATGPIAGLTKVVPGTPADRTDKLVQSALSNIGIDQLQAMRDASPTGGALGQIPVQQQKRLESMLGSLDVQQYDKDWVNNAKRAQNLYLDMIHGPDAGPPRQDLEFDYLGRSIGPRPEGLTTEEWFNMDPEDRRLFE